MKLFFAGWIRLLTVCIFCFFSCSVTPEWKGIYTFFEEQPAQSTEDSPLQWRYKLEVADGKGERYRARLAMDGYEIQAVLPCYAVTNGGRLEIYSDTSAFSFYRNQLLFMLKTDHDSLVTFWEGMKPKTENLGKAFRKTAH